MPNDRVTWFECNYYLINNQAMENAQITTSSIHPGSKLDRLLSLPEDEQYITLYEHNYSVLDGSLLEMPDDGRPAYISSDISDENGDFTSPYPYIQASFTNPQNSYGVQLNFNTDYPKEILITITNSGGVVLQYTFYPNSTRYVIPLELINILNIKIEFIKTLPYRAVKVNTMVFGQVIYWGENDISDGSLLLESDILGDKLSINTLNFNVIDKNNTYNLANENGLHRYFQKKQKVYAYEYINGDRKFLGKYFLDTFSWDSNLVSLKCVSYMGWLDDIQFIDGDYYDGMTAGAILSAIFDTAEITEYTIDPDTYSTRLYGTLKPQTCREALREVLFACNSLIRTTGENGIEIYKIGNTSMLGTIYRNKKISTKVTKNDYVYGVAVEYSTFSLNTDETDEIITDEFYEAGTHLIMFNSMYENIKVFDESGNQIVAPALKTVKKYYCILELDEPETITITGNELVENVITAQVTNMYLEAGETETINTYSSTLCNNELALNKAKLILEQLQYRLTLDIQTIATDYSLDGGRLVQNSNVGYGGFVAWYTSREFNLTGGFIDTSKLMGYYFYQEDVYYTAELDTELYAGEQIGVI